MRKKVVVITGPTGIGKTELSLELAKEFNGEIINADASSIRRDLSIGTAKIDLNLTDVVHHLVDIIDADSDFSIKEYQDLAREKIAEITHKNKLPFLVGGSGLYINSTILSYDLSDTGRDLKLEESLYSDYSNIKLFEILKELDSIAASKLHPNNRRRVARAIEMAKAGKKISSIPEADSLLYDALIIEITTDRNILYERINRRFDLMIKSGWLAEVELLRKNNKDFKKIKEIGYDILNEHLLGHISFEDASNQIKQKTRNYAKRQITWFKNKLDTVQVEIDYNNLNDVLKKLKLLINEFLNEGANI